MLSRIASQAARRAVLSSRSASAAPLGARCFWGDVEMAPPDAIFGLTEAFKKDTFPDKMNLGVGAYRDDEGKPYVLPSVREAERRILDAQMDHEYLPIAGDGKFLPLSLKFCYGDDSAALKEGRVAAIQTISGTGALSTVGRFLHRFRTGTPLYMSDPTWANHGNIFNEVNVETRSYRYYDPSTISLNFDGMRQDMEAMEDGAAILLHTCAHNPTGIDPTAEQWSELCEIAVKKDLICVFDNAYQGFASGDAEHDAASLRTFVDNGANVICTQSYSKNFGLYGERVGAVSYVCKDDAIAKAVESQLKRLTRAAISNPPIHGARVVSTVLTDAALTDQFRVECKGMADQIISMRTLLTAELEKAGSTLDWGHINKQIGMFCYSGLSPEEVAKLIDEHHVYLTKDGRISMAGVSSHNAAYLANAIHQVTKDR